MAKYLRIPSSAQPASNPDRFIDVDSILNMVASSSTVLHINSDFSDTGGDTIVLTFNNSSPAPDNLLHQLVCDAITAAAAYNKGGDCYYDLPPLPAIGGTATTITVTTS
jgi:hypothetical protein